MFTALGGPVVPTNKGKPSVLSPQRIRGRCACWSVKLKRVFTEKKWWASTLPRSLLSSVNPIHAIPKKEREGASDLFVHTSRADSIDPRVVGIVTGGVPVTVVHRVDRVEVLSVKLDAYEKELLYLEEAGKIPLSQADISEKKELIKAA